MVQEEAKCDKGGSAEVSEEQKEIPKIEENEEEPHDDAKEEETCEAEEGEKGADDEATAEKDEAEEQSEAHLPANGNAAPDDKTTDSAEGDADVDAENDGERKEEAAVETDYHPDETEQRRESGEEDESSVSEQPKQTDEAAVLDNAEAEAADATMEMKAESSEKQEALSCEEAPEAVTEGEADAEEEAEVTAESSSNQPQEDGDTPVHSTAEEGGGGEDEEHVSGAETGAEHSQQEIDELEEEKMVGGYEKTEELKPEKEVEEEEKQKESEEVEEGSNDESTVDQNTENSAEISEKDTNAEVEVEGEETKEDEAATEEKEEEPVKTGTNEGNDIDEKKKETRESEKDEDESDGGEDRSSANLAAVKKDDGAENSEKDGGEENTEQYETERREETSQVIEEPELREESKVDEELVQISTEIPADVPADEEETASINKAENVQKEDEKGKIEAKDEEIEAPEENSSTSHEKDMKTEGQEEEEGKTEEPAEGEDPEEAPEKMKDEVVRETSTVVIETSENEGDDSLKVYDEFTKMGSEASGGEPKEHPDESRACEEGDQSDADHQNTTSDLTEKDKDIQNVTETQETPDAGDVGEAEHWLDEEEQVLDDAAGDDAPAADGADTEEVSKASEEGASVLLKPHSQHGEAGDTGRREAAEAPEVFAREDNTDLVTSWISVHQTSKFFQTFVEPLDDLTDAVVAPNSENKETASELQRSQSPGKLEAKSEDEEHKQMFKDELEFLEDGSAKTTRQVEEETEAKSSTSPTEPDDKQSPKEIKSEELQGRGASSGEDEAGPAEGQHQEQIKVKSTLGSHHSASTSQPENQLSENATGPDVAAVRTTPEAPLEGEKNSHTEESWENAYSRQVTQITDFTTSVSVDGSREEPREEGEEMQRKGLEESFLNKDIEQTLHAEKLSPFSVDETLFAHTSYPLLTEL